MNRTILTCLAVLSLASAPCFAKNKEKSHAPLPPQILAAKTVYIENNASADIADKAFGELKKWGRFEVVTDRAKADLILLLSMKQPQEFGITVRDENGNLSRGGGGTPGYSYLTVVDPKTGETLYSDAREWGSRFRSATRGMIRELRKRVEAQEKQPSPK